MRLEQECRSRVRPACTGSGRVLVGGAALIACCVVALLGAPARADIPDPIPFTIPQVLASPDGSLAYQVSYVRLSGPVPGLTVELRYMPAADAAVCWCPGQAHPIISAVTDANGVATFHIRAGLCVNPDTVPGGIAVEVWIDGIKERERGQVSPEIVATANCEVTLASTVLFTMPLATSSYGYCFDLNSDGQITLSDAILFTSPAANAARCQ